MECRHPPPLADEQLLAELDGEAAPHVAEHLADCPSCRARLADMRQFEQRLTMRLYRWDCPSSLQLGGYHLGLTAAPEAARIAAHLGQCAHCSAEIALLRSFMDDASAAPELSPAAPPRPTYPWLGDLIARSLAPARAAAPALRGGAPRSITAEAGHATIILEVQPSPAGWVTLRGQILEDDQDRWIGALVEVRQSGALATTTLIDDIGGFSCGLLLSDPAELRITPESGRAVLVPQIDLIT